ncbi:hypothetical protein NDU88_001296 [Pleurodeles waltl]|uniref:Uncharacterized protein n=1 Tax=Pleurodeles waltl TaxID=8319 RepID=A0AAV7VZN0_PLEWA|nr:hypothetical protein NDU88_001296 [Pleurodeles waltl]
MKPACCWRCAHGEEAGFVPIPPRSAYRKREVEVSENNQGEIKEVCDVMESKINSLTERMSRMEKSVEEQERQVHANSHDISQLKAGEKAIQDKLENVGKPYEKKQY